MAKACLGGADHQWERWRVVNEGEVLEQRYLFGRPVAGGAPVIGHFLTQQRICTVCGKVELDQQQVMLNDR